MDLTAAFPRQRGKIILYFNELQMIDGNQLNDMQITRTSFQTNKHVSTPSLNFYWLDAFPGTQSMVSKQ